MVNKLSDIKRGLSVGTVKSGDLRIGMEMVLISMKMSGNITSTKLIRSDISSWLFPTQCFAMVITLIVFPLTITITSPRLC